MKRIMKLVAHDNIAIAFEAIQAGDALRFEDQTLVALDDIPFGHKVAMADIPDRGTVFRYGVPIGHALHDIPKGSHVHSHNLATNFLDHQSHVVEPTPHAVESASPAVEPTPPAAEPTPPAVEPTP
ncbi:UxaA family hydrolase [Castellaniella sp.]|uniref:UxaA family hydrolase n=1 Tax=Castellaniella sp. TaxID=1955812 RepID=UPI003568E808